MFPNISAETRRAPTRQGTPVSVGTTAVSLDAGKGLDNLAVGATIYNDGPDTIYIGGSDVTATNGHPVAALGSFDLFALPSLTWAICDTGDSAVVRVVGA